MTSKNRLCVALFMVLLSCGFFVNSQASGVPDEIKIGFNLSLSGDWEASGASTREGAELLRDQINEGGGLQIGEKKYPVKYVFADNKSTPQGAVNATIKLITQESVLGIVGPSSSSNAIPAGNISQSFKTPMISPTSTNPKTTANRPFVFRACFLDEFQGEVMAKFSVSEFNATKAAVLYNIANAYPRGLAEYFKSAFESLQGEGSVVAFENYLYSEKDFSKQLSRIVASEADVLFVPQYSYEVPSIVRQARAIGWTKPILGGDAWETSDLMKNCGDDCKGLFFSSHFSSIGTKGKTQKFVEAYQQKHNRLPSGDAALGYDATNLLLTSVGAFDKLEGSLLENRTKLKNGLVAIKGFEGVSGSLDMNEAGDPVKSATVILINDQGDFESYKIENP